VNFEVGARPWRAVSLGGEFVTWETSPLGIPVHLHTLGGRVDLAPDPRDGVFVSGSAGMALTQGDIINRAGGAAALVGGYRLPFVPWLSGLVEAGAHGHIYADGSALLLLASVGLRAHHGGP
jgi:hypothetical protein